ncbi:MAG: ATP-binding protein [Elusimicrobiota bacterium]
MKQILVLSGKGGTGKTTVAGAFAGLAAPCVIADCDVDAANLHIILSPKEGEVNFFYGGKKAFIDPVKCVNCGYCAKLCRFEAISFPPHRVNELSCEGCGVCVWNCLTGAITLKESLSGRWSVSECRLGPFVGARLEPSAENSGKLVALLKKEAVKIAEAVKARYLILDGAPGIGCPVLASLSGIDAVVVVAEPTISGRSDFIRLAELLKNQGMRTFLLVNKWDINPQETENIERIALDFGFKISGRIPFDIKVVETMLNKKVLSEVPDFPAAVEIKKAWNFLVSDLKE